MTFVSRAASKLEKAIQEFDLKVSGLVCADFGSSTGGFVEILLREGAEKVYSVDTSYGELAWVLRTNPKVVVLERTNAMHVELPELVDLITIDVSFTRQEKILPNALRNLKDGGLIVSLLKPHYEASASELKKGKLSDESLPMVVDSVLEKIRANFKVVIEKVIESPIEGLRGHNKEFLLFIRKL